MTPKTFWKPLCLLLGVAACGVANAEVNDKGATVKWSYVGTSGPQHWGSLDPAFKLCDTGKSQSPINLSRNNRVTIPYALKINYHAVPMQIAEDMDTKFGINPSQTVINAGHGVQLNFNNKDKERVTFNGKDYELIQFHFHSPSQTLWHKQAFPLELEFIHQGKDGMLVLSVFIKGGEANKQLQAILDHLPSGPKQEMKLQNIEVNPAELLPENQRYYYYIGSLTTPPCTEGVQWIVMPEAITASPAQIAKIRAASNGTNARPVQPMNGRTLYYAVPE